MVAQTRETTIINAYLKGGAPERNSDTGGRKYWTSKTIARLWTMGLTGEPDFNLDRATKFNPRFDSPPYPVSDMLLVEPPNGKKVITDMTFDTGNAKFSSGLIYGEYSWGATHENVHKALAEAAKKLNFIFGTGEGGVQPALAIDQPAMNQIMVQIASGLFGITAEIVGNAVILSVKLSQIAKAGMGGQAPSKKLNVLNRLVRGLPFGVDALSDANRNLSIEEIRAIADVLKVVVEAVRQVSDKPIFIKAGATHSFEAVSAGTMRSGAQGIIIDGLGGGTGAAPDLHKQYIGMAIEQAVVLANRQRSELGMHDFVIIAAGRVDTPEKAFKLTLLGADGWMQGTGSLVDLGCLVVNRCQKQCSRALAAILKMENGKMERLLDIAWGQNMIGNAYQAFTAELALFFGAYGFAKPRDARGRSDLLYGHDMPDILAKMLGVRNEKIGLIYPVPGNLLLEFGRKRLAELADTGKPIISSMGRTTDLDAPHSWLDRLTHEGRAVIGPAFDHHRDEIETHVRLPGDVIIGMPIVLEGGGEETRRLAKETNTIALEEGMETSSKHALLTLSPSGFGNDWYRLVGEKLYELRDCAGLVVDGKEIGPEAMELLDRYVPDTPVYAKIRAGRDAREEAMKLAKMGVKCIIIEGDLSIGKETDISIALSQVNDALVNGINPQTWNIFRNEVKLMVRTRIRNPRDIFALSCLGADATICNLDELVPGMGYARKLNLVRGMDAEIGTLMGAAGLSMMNSVLGNRGILRADHYMRKEIAELLGVDFIGV